ncbi:MAG TPA: FHA domain-containing protein [Blastocatellia bacterium]|nr:FHA domain-containing protein [Blastocatellia bacterium]
MAFQGWIQNLRKWIDGEEPLEEDNSPRPRSKWEDFLVAVAREIEQTMLREMFTPPGGPTYIPREYIVFLSTGDDADWQGEKREGLQRGLHHVLSERAKELVGTQEFQTKTFSVELRVDGTLEAGKFRVQHIWDTSSPKTMVKPRRPTVVQQAPATQSMDTPPKAGQVLEALASSVGDSGPKDKWGSEPDNEATIVRPRTPKTPLFSISIRRLGGPYDSRSGSSGSASTAMLSAEPAEQSASNKSDSAETRILDSTQATNSGGDAGSAEATVRTFFQDEITIGRGSSQVTVDLALEGDMEVSRKHATLRRRDGAFEVTCHGANPLVLNGQREIATGESAGIKAGDKIGICSYELQLVL